ncbi:AAA-domain-containing protein [Obba rivulosa]|uniref:AAA-domain-containing protein n=1 Tax=Obba rivulosa TaxID=1052685 RepID=A0A8E2DMX8_9APHY|nr:AAA-domain-containing protein [Obba rivulosa]
MEPNAATENSTRQTVFLLLNSYLVLDTLPSEYDSRVKAMEVDERPAETYTDIGGLEKQTKEFVEAIGCLMYGPPAVRDATFELAKEKAPAVIFPDELDAIDTKQFNSEKSGDRGVQRTILELLGQLDGFSSDDRIKVRIESIVTRIFQNSSHLPNRSSRRRTDILDRALLQSGRLDRKIEFPLPNETARACILEIHSRKMTVSPGVNFKELTRSTDELNGAQLEAVCVEAAALQDIVRETTVLALPLKYLHATIPADERETIPLPMLLHKRLDLLKRSAQLSESRLRRSLDPPHLRRH